MGQAFAHGRELGEEKPDPCQRSGCRVVAGDQEGGELITNLLVAQWLPCLIGGCEQEPKQILVLVRCRATALNKTSDFSIHKLLATRKFSTLGRWNPQGHDPGEDGAILLRE